LIVMITTPAQQTAAIVKLDVLMLKWFVSTTIASPPAVMKKLDAPKQQSIVMIATAVQLTLVIPVQVLVWSHPFTAMITTSARMILAQMDSVSLPLFVVMTSMLALLTDVIKLLVCALIHRWRVTTIVYVQKTVAMMVHVFTPQLIVTIMTRAL
jgi:hypothetical protein